jgi:hypothetical protein
MAIKQQLAIKTVTGTTQLKITAKPGESLLVKDIHVYNTAANYVTLKIDKTTVGYFRTGGPLGNHIPFLKRKGTISGDSGESLGSPEETALGLLARLGIFTGYPVGEGETFMVETTQNASTIISVEYEIHDAEDIKPDMPNGTKATRYSFMNYGHTGDAIAAAGTYLYDTSSSPDEFPAFPFGKTVPAKLNAKIHAMFASDVTIIGNATTKYVKTAYIKMVKDRETLFDEDRNGIPFFSAPVGTTDSVTYVAQGYSLIHNNSDVDFEQPLIFNPALEYTQGDELNIYITTEAGSSNPDFTTALQEIGLWIEISRAE